MIVLTFVTLLHLTLTGALTWNDCGSTDRSIIVHKIDVAGDPVVISPARPLQMGFNFTLLETIDETVQLDADLKRYTKIFGVRTAIPIPCLRSDFGSCSGTFCSFFQSYSKLTRLIMEELGLPFVCNLPRREYLADISFNVPYSTMAKIPPIILKVAEGEYELILRFSKQGRELGCLTIDTDILIN